MDPTNSPSPSETVACVNPGETYCIRTTTIALAVSFSITTATLLALLIWWVIRRVNGKKGGT